MELGLLFDYSATTVKRINNACVQVDER